MEIYKMNDKFNVGKYRYRISTDGHGRYYCNPQVNTTFGSIHKIFNVESERECAPIMEKITGKILYCEITPRFNTLEQLTLVVHVMKEIVENNTPLEEAILKIKYNNEVEIWTNF